MDEFIKKAKVILATLKIKASTVEELVEQSDIIITTTTSKDPVIPILESIDMTGKHYRCFRII